MLVRARTSACNGEHHRGVRVTAREMRCITVTLACDRSARRRSRHTCPLSQCTQAVGGLQCCGAPTLIFARTPFPGERDAHHR